MKTRLFLLILLGTFILSSCHKDNNTGTNKQVSSVQLSESTLSLVVGGRKKLLLIVEPAGASVSDAKWTSSNPSVATVNEKGTVTALATGQTIITLSTGNTTTQQCTLNVIASPITDLIMPDVEYPIAKDVFVILQGTGFKTGDKIWLRMNNNSGTGLKSAQTGGDVLAEIHELAANYISFKCSVTPSWYSVVLEDNGTQFDLGNMKVETPIIPEYVYDKNKIFWDDTHLRWMQLRGKVKEMKVTQLGDFPDNKIYRYRFNDKGYLISSVDSWADSTSNTFDTNNRIKSSIFFTGNNSLTSWTGIANDRTQKYTYIYGNDSKYFRLGSGQTNRWGFQIFNYLSNDATGFCNPGLLQGIFVKGLIDIKNDEYGFDKFAFNITVSPDSIKTFVNWNNISNNSVNTSSVKLSVI